MGLWDLFRRNVKLDNMEFSKINNKNFNLLEIEEKKYLALTVGEEVLLFEPERVVLKNLIDKKYKEKIERKQNKLE